MTERRHGYFVRPRGRLHIQKVGGTAQSTATDFQPFYTRRWRTHYYWQNGFVSQVRNVFLKIGMGLCVMLHFHEQVGRIVRAELTRVFGKQAVSLHLEAVGGVATSTATDF